MTTTTLSRSNDGRIIAGVCTGLAAHLELPVTWVRVGFVGLAALGGAGLLLYAWLWALVPLNEEVQVAPMRHALTEPAVGHSRADATVAASNGSHVGAVDHSAPAAAAPGVEGRFTPVDRAMRWPVAELLLGVCLLVVGVGIVLVQAGVELRLDMLLSAVAVLAGVGLTWWQIADRRRPERRMLPRVLGALALVAIGVLMFFITANQPSAFTVIAAAFAVLAGVALALAPWALRLNRELIAERAGRAREAERAEIAAHLHDSVLQTLAAIQQRSEPGSEVARLARGQERDLREWLFRAADGAAAADAAAADSAAIDAELRAHVAALESEHTVRFEVVSVGASRSVPEPIVAAAKEAMLNAARHAGGEVTVYIEATLSQVSVDITDRGPGLDLTALPEGRMGVRESIVGRMQRAGGEAHFSAGPGGTGTAVRLTVPLEPTDTDDQQSRE